MRDACGWRRGDDPFIPDVKICGAVRGLNNTHADIVSPDFHPNDGLKSIAFPIVSGVADIYLPEAAWLLRIPPGPRQRIAHAHAIVVVGVSTEENPHTVEIVRQHFPGFDSGLIQSGPFIAVAGKRRFVDGDEDMGGVRGRENGFFDPAPVPWSQPEPAPAVVEINGDQARVFPVEAIVGIVCAGTRGPGGYRGKQAVNQVVAVGRLFGVMVAHDRHIKRGIGHVAEDFLVDDMIGDERVEVSAGDHEVSGRHGGAGICAAVADFFEHAAVTVITVAVVGDHGERPRRRFLRERRGKEE